MVLKLVPKTEPDPAQRVRERVKKMARPDGMLQCNRCGGRTVMTAKTGVIIKNGRKTGGTVTEDNVCADCFKRGIFSPMLPPLQPVK